MDSPNCFRLAKSRKSRLWKLMTQQDVKDGIQKLTSWQNFWIPNIVLSERSIYTLSPQCEQISLSWNGSIFVWFSYEKITPPSAIFRLKEKLKFAKTSSTETEINIVPFKKQEKLNDFSMLEKRWESGSSNPIVVTFLWVKSAELFQGGGGEIKFWSLVEQMEPKFPRTRKASKKSAHTGNASSDFMASHKRIWTLEPWSPPSLFVSKYFQRISKVRVHCHLLQKRIAELFCWIGQVSERSVGWNVYVFAG